MLISDHIYDVSLSKQYQIPKLWQVSPPNIMLKEAVVIWMQVCGMRTIWNPQPTQLWQEQDLLLTHTVGCWYCHVKSTSWRSDIKPLWMLFVYTVQWQWVGRHQVTRSGNGKLVHVLSVGNVGCVVCVSVGRVGSVPIFSPLKSDNTAAGACHYCH